MSENRRGLSLCVRCQRRLDWLELGQGFRYECQDQKVSVSACYGFVPQLPVYLEKSDPKDARPGFAPAALSARMRVYRQSENSVDARLWIAPDSGNENGAALYWSPSNVRAQKTLKPQAKKPARE